ncbi:MAG TPA: hypothetical protein VNS88_03185 [Nitrospiraceae bacterium]|nr:hypothetical protein [Nitrospiraceae bacterium]
MRSRTELSPLQLNIVMHIANGMAFRDIADTCVCSVSYVKQQAGVAKRKTQTRTLPQLVSVVIARGQLEWSPMDAGRVVSADGDGAASDGNTSALLRGT